MKTIEQIKEELASKKQQSEVVDMLIKAETLRRQINEYLQQDKNGNMNIDRRETLADASEDIYQVEFALGKVIGSNIVENIMNQW